MTKPIVTIGIPFYNCQKTLLSSIRSIFAQTFQDWELILINDGSTDESFQIASSIYDPRVRVISDGENRKLPYRLNQIIDLAQGEYIARMDADDMCSPERLLRQLELFSKQPDLDVVGTGITYLDSNDMPLGHKIAPTQHVEICKEPHRTFWLCHASIVARRSWYQKNRYNESALLSQDYNLWLNSYENSKFGNVSEALYYYRCESSFSQRKLFTSRISVMRFIFDYYKRKGRSCVGLYYSTIQLVKLLAGAAICLVQSEKKLLAMRFDPISEQKKRFYCKEIAKIQSTELPLKSS